MINRDDIEVGDKCFTRDGGCLVAIAGEDGVYVFNQLVQDLWNHDLSFTHLGQHPLDIIRIEKAPKPVVGEVLLVSDDGLGWCANPESSIYSWNHIIKLTIINGKFDKAEQMK